MQKTKTFNPNNAMWFYCIITFTALSLMFIFLREIVLSNLILTLVILFIFLLNGYFLYVVMSHKIVVEPDRIIIHKLFGDKKVFDYQNHQFVFKGTLIRKNNPDKILINPNTTYQKLMWIYPIDENGALQKMESVYFEWNMMNKTYLDLQNQIEHHCKVFGLQHHVEKSKTNESIIQEI